MKNIDINSLNVKEYYRTHRKAVEQWVEGEPIEAWYDDNYTLCIKYQSGNWWHYRINNKELQWW